MADNPPQSEPRYAGFWLRLGAFSVDVLVIIAILLPLMMALYGGGYLGRLGAEYALMMTPSGDPAADAARILDVLGRPNSAIAALTDLKVQIGLLVATVLFWRLRGATPGKMLLKAKIVNARTLGTPSTGSLIGRFFAYFVSFIPAGLGFVWIAFDKRKQGWHDKLAGTVVVRAPE